MFSDFEMLFRSSMMFQKLCSISGAPTIRRMSIKRPSSFRPDSEGGASKYALLIIPVTTFGLGVWQVKRKSWKEGLVKSLEERISAPIMTSLPLEYKEVKEYEYHRVQVTGRFLHHKEMFLAPRSKVEDIREVNPSGLITAGQKNTVGLWVVTPFQLEGGEGHTILINRGWIPREKMNPSTRLSGQVEGLVQLTGIIRKTENRPQFGQKNDPKKIEWTYRDLEAMSERLGTLPIFLDADKDSTIEGGPIGGQTRVQLRNEHMSYIVTWFSLSVFTLYIWWMKHGKKKPRIVL